MSKENSNLKKNIWVLEKILSGHMISKSIPESPRQVGPEKYRPGIHTPVPRRRMFVTSQFVTSAHFVTNSQIVTISFKIVTGKIVTNL